MHLEIHLIGISLIKMFSIGFSLYGIAVEQILKGVYSSREYVESIHVIGCQSRQQKEVT